MGSINTSTSASFFIESVVIGLLQLCSIYMFNRKVIRKKK